MFNIHFNIDTVLKFLYFYLLEKPILVVNVLFKVTPKYIIIYYKFFRSVLHIHSEQVENIGGKGKIVQIDEFKVVSRENNKGIVPTTSGLVFYGI